MTVLLWAAIAYVALSVPARSLDRGFEALRVRSDRAPLIVDVLRAAAVVAAARELGGPYEAGAAVIGAVGGHCWPLLWRRDRPMPGIAPAVGAYAILLPVELAGAAIVIALALAARAGRAAVTAALLAVPVAAGLRQQVSPYVLVAWVVVALVVVHRLDGVSEEIRAGGSRAAAIVRRVVFGTTEA